jgi:uncharacterized protein YjbJ (UPF0337 family)
MSQCNRLGTSYVYIRKADKPTSERRRPCPAGAAGKTITKGPWTGPKGRMKEAGGALPGDKSKKREGRSDQRKGRAKEKKGDLKDLLS